MADMRYLKASEKFLGYSWDIFADYYNNKETFISQFNSINTDEEKNKFLKLSSLYKFLVRDGRFSVNNEQGFFNNIFVDNIDETYKFIALMAFIETIYEDQKFIDFHDWLIQKERRKDIFPIKNIQELENQYRDYKSKYGASQKVRSFFALLDSETQQFLASRIRINGDYQPIEALAKMIYEIRSEFVHRAKLVLEFNNLGRISYRGNSEVVSYISLRDLGVLFEYGLLQHFGFIFEKRKY